MCTSQNVLAGKNILTIKVVVKSWSTQEHKDTRARTHTYMTFQKQGIASGPGLLRHTLYHQGSLPWCRRPPHCEVLRRENTHTRIYTFLPTEKHLEQEHRSDATVDLTPAAVTVH